MVKELCEAGARVNVEDEAGGTPLQAAVLSFRVVEVDVRRIRRVVRVLLEYGADRDVVMGFVEQGVGQLLSTYFPLRDAVLQMVLALHRADDDTVMGRVGRHDLFDMNVMGIVAGFAWGKDSGGMEELLVDAYE